MISYILLCVLLVSLVNGEAPKSNARFLEQFQNLESAPYPPSGWRPSGPQFRLPEPSQEYGPPSQEYGPPSQEYDPPSQEYGPPEADSTTTTTDVPTTTSSAESVTINIRSGIDEQENEAFEREERGVYYIYHPSGLLQKVKFATNDDVKNMAFSARLQYENVEPIRDPVFTYDPITYQFRKL
nr:uncharacterized protein LOC111514706 [Leptinotarsa decemlineata]